MVIRSRENLIGAWAFLIGVIVAVLVGTITALFDVSQINVPLISITLAAMGLVVGYFVAEKDVQTFLFASVSIVIVSYMWMQGVVLSSAFTGANMGRGISLILQSFLSLFVPATITVALKTMFSISQS